MRDFRVAIRAVRHSSMKVPPKRKGNYGITSEDVMNHLLNESPSEKEGK